MIIWSGFGFLVAVIVFGCSLLMELITESFMKDDQFYQKSAWAFPLALILAGGLTFACDTMLRSRTPGQNSLFFIPMKWWGPLLAVIGVGVMLYNMFFSAARA